MIRQFHNFFNLIFGGFLLFGPTVWGSLACLSCAFSDQRSGKVAAVAQWGEIISEITFPFFLIILMFDEKTSSVVILSEDSNWMRWF